MYIKQTNCEIPLKYNFPFFGDTIEYVGALLYSKKYLQDKES